MDPSSHLLIVEDDGDISAMVSHFMREHGFRVSRAANGKALDRVMADSKIDLVLLDLMLPGEDGLAICRRLRTVSTVPIVMLTALGAEADRVLGLELGADDYLTKPFSTRELLARVRAVLRRSDCQTFQPDRQPCLRLTVGTWALVCVNCALPMVHGYL